MSKFDLNEERITMPTFITKNGNKTTISIADAVNQSINIDEILKRVEESFAAPKMKSISCLHCGAPLEMKLDDHIVNCSYCHSVYAIDMEMIRDLGRGER